MGAAGGGGGGHAVSLRAWVPGWLHKAQTFLRDLKMKMMARVSVCVYVSICISVYACMSQYDCVCPSMYLCVSISMCLHICVYLRVSCVCVLCVSISMCFCMYFCVCLYVGVCVSYPFPKVMILEEGGGRVTPGGMRLPPQFPTPFLHSASLWTLPEPVSGVVTQSSQSPAPGTICLYPGPCCPLTLTARRPS